MAEPYRRYIPSTLASFNELLSIPLSAWILMLVLGALHGMGGTEFVPPISFWQALLVKLAFDSIWPVSIRVKDWRELGDR